MVSESSKVYDPMGDTVNMGWQFPPLNPYVRLPPHDMIITTNLSSLRVNIIIEV